MGRMGDTQPRTWGSNQGGAAAHGEGIGTVRASRETPHRVADMDQPVSLEKLRGMGGPAEGGETRNGMDRCAGDQ